MQRDAAEEEMAASPMLPVNTSDFRLRKQKTLNMQNAVKVQRHCEMQRKQFDCYFDFSVSLYSL